MWSSIKTHGSKVITRNTFHGDPRLSKLWRWRARRSQVERQFDCTIRQRKRTSKLPLSKNFLSIAIKKSGASCDVHASSRNISVANSTLATKA